MDHPIRNLDRVRRSPVNRWTHVALVRDLAAGRLRWYFNGNQVAARPAAYPVATASTAPVRMGKGFAGSFHGMIGQTMLLSEALDAAAVETLYQQTRHHRPLPHTNFSLRLEGESVILTKPDGTVADSLPAIELRRDLSYGRAGDGAESFRVFGGHTVRSKRNGELGILPSPCCSQRGVL